jgi:diguanylate cyclase (GGDEF)-like protein
MVARWHADSVLMRVGSSRRLALALMVPVLLIGGAVFATADIERNAALLGARRAAASEQLLTSMLNQETGARGFFQTREAVFLQPVAQGTAEFAQSVAELRGLVAGDPRLIHMLDDQVRRAAGWHADTEAAIATVGRTGHSQTVTAALHAKTVMDEFRAANAAFDAQLVTDNQHGLAVATAIAVGVAAALVIMLVWLGLSLTGRTTRREEAHQRDQSDLRDLLQSSESEEESRALLIRHLVKMFPGARAAVFNRNNSDDRLEVTRDATGEAIPAGSPLAAANAEQLRPRSCMAVRLSRPYDQRPGDNLVLRCEICGDMRAAAACEPLLVGGQVIGSVLVVSNRPLDGNRRARLHESVAQATPILANQRNLSLAETRAASDALTGLPNRRSANETLKRMAAHAGRSVSPLAAILLDLDHFKKLNDRYGHDGGDRALALVGRIINSTIRTSDFAARFGGEEFLVLLPDTDRPGAILVAEKLRSEIENSELPGISSITASLGVAVLPADAVEVEELLRKADRALYAAKESGRNRVHSFARSAADAHAQPSDPPVFDPGFDA